MATTIENLTGRKVLIRLSSGQTLHIAPRTTSEALSDVEVKNQKVQKLQDRRVVALHTDKALHKAEESVSPLSDLGASESDA